VRASKPRVQVFAPVRSILNWVRPLDAPMVAERVTVVQAAWTPTEWAERRVIKPEPFRLARIELPDEAREVMDDAGEVDW